MILEKTPTEKTFWTPDELKYATKFELIDEIVEAHLKCLECLQRGYVLAYTVHRDYYNKLAQAYNRRTATDFFKIKK